MAVALSTGTFVVQRLDWGGAGSPLLLLTGMSHTAHLSDELAPALTVRYHMWTFTLRVHDRSDHPVGAAPPTV